jgi:hypothetical protein
VKHASDTDPILTLDKHLGSMESDELARLADRLETLKASDGWDALVGLIEIQRSKVAESPQRQLWSLYRSGKPPADPSPFVLAAGVEKGLGQAVAIVDKVLGLNARVQAELDRTGS